MSYSHMYHKFIPNSVVEGLVDGGYDAARIVLNECFIPYMASQVLSSVNISPQILESVMCVLEALHLDPGRIAVDLVKRNVPQNVAFEAMATLISSAIVPTARFVVEGGVKDDGRGLKGGMNR